MPTDRAKIRRRRVLAVAEEGTTGTAETLAAGDGAFNAYDFGVSYNVNQNRREREGGFGYHTSVPGARSGTASFMTHLVGSGGSGLPLEEFFWECCGFVGSAGTYTLSTGLSEVTATVGYYEDGRVHTMAGCAGNVSATFTSGEPVPLNWEFTGKVLEPQTATLISPTFPTTKPPRFAAATITIGGTSYKVSEVGFNLNATVTLREDAGADDDAGRSGDGTGFHAAQVVNVDPVFTIDPEAGTKNWYEDMLDGDTAELVIAVGSASNNTMTITAGAVQVRSAQPQDRNGLIVDALELECTGATLMTVAYS